MENYDVLRFWALGRESELLHYKWHEVLQHKVTFQPLPKAENYYKRVVVAVRLKRDDKLILKGFKEVPVNDLEKLLPDGKIKMSKLDKTIMSTTIGKLNTFLTSWVKHILFHNEKGFDCTIK